MSPLFNTAELTHQLIGTVLHDLSWVCAIKETSQICCNSLKTTALDGQALSFQRVCVHDKKMCFKCQAFKNVLFAIMLLFKKTFIPLLSTTTSI